MDKKQNEVLFTNELLLEQQKKNKKPFYKNWKTYAISLGIIVIGTGTGLGIYYGVTANQDSSSPLPTPGLTDRDIINKINETNYETAIIVNSKVEDFKNIITGTFIKNKLEGEFNSTFNSDFFNYKRIMVGDQDLTDDNLRKAETFAAEIVYTYHSDIEYKTKLAITVTEISDHQIVAAINQTTYEKKVNFKSSITELKVAITPSFIVTPLDDELKKEYQEDLFTLIEITNEKDQALTNKDFETVGIINAKIVYTYGTLTNQKTKLTITVTEAEITDKYELNDGNVNTLLQASNGKLYAGTMNGNIWEVSLNENQASKKYELNDESINILLQASNGKLYAGTTKNNVWEIDLKNDSTTLKFKDYGDNYDTTSLIEANGKLYAGTGVGNVYELNLETGSSTYKYRFEDWGFVTVLFQASNGKLYAGTTEGKLWEIDLAQKKYKLIFASDETNAILDMTEIEENKLVLTSKDKIYQFDLIENQISELFNLDDGEIFALAEGANKELYVATINGNVYELDLENQTIKNKYEINASVYSLIIVNKKLYAGTITSIWELTIV